MKSSRRGRLSTNSRPEDRRSSLKSKGFSYIFFFGVIILVTVAIMFFQAHSAASNVTSTGTERVSPTSEIRSANQIPATLLSKNIDLLPQKARRLRIAFAITMTQDGNFQDGAAILAYSIAEISQGKDYDVSLIAFLHPEVVLAETVLKNLGFHVIRAPTPINVTAIKYEFLREKINKNGCCGAAELIKLNAYRLTQYDRIVHMDADTYIINSIDHLYKSNFSLIYTTDPNMASFKADDKMPVQGGFLVLQPNLDDYYNLVNILMTTEFRKGKGWNSSQIGWFWGGMTVQGVLPYYYNRVTTPNRSARVNRCLYNTMADTEDCTKQTLNEIKTVHFTVCQKPWQCYRAWINSLCGDLHRRWFELRKKAEAFYGLQPVEKACTGGHGTYQMMKLEVAKLPPGIFRPDDSPDFLGPVGNHGFLSDEYETISGGKLRMDALEKEKLGNEKKEGQGEKKDAGKKEGGAGRGGWFTSQSKGGKVKVQMDRKTKKHTLKQVKAKKIDRTDQDDLEV